MCHKSWAANRSASRKYPLLLGEDQAKGEWRRPKVEDAVEGGGALGAAEGAVGGHSFDYKVWQTEARRHIVNNSVCILKWQHPLAWHRPPPCPLPPFNHRPTPTTPLCLISFCRYRSAPHRPLVLLLSAPLPLRAACKWNVIKIATRQRHGQRRQCCSCHYRSTERKVPSKGILSQCN